LNGIFLAHKINREEALTLPDVLARRYGKSVEFLVSLTTITSFLMLLAGNLVGMGVVTAYLWGIEESAGIWLAAGIVWVSITSVATMFFHSFVVFLHVSYLLKGIHRLRWPVFGRLH
jgi:Na+/proline symporter